VAVKFINKRHRRDDAVGRVHVGGQDPDAPGVAAALDLAVPALDVDAFIQSFGPAHEPGGLVVEDRGLVAGRGADDALGVGRRNQVVQRQRALSK
jgi:hypothetical protein